MLFCIDMTASSFPRGEGALEGFQLNELVCEVRGEAGQLEMERLKKDFRYCTEQYGYFGTSTVLYFNNFEKKNKF